VVKKGQGWARCTTDDRARATAFTDSSCDLECVDVVGPRMGEWLTE
jgi:hypothetical protein